MCIGLNDQPFSGSDQIDHRRRIARLKTFYLRHHSPFLDHVSFKFEDFDNTPGNPAGNHTMARATMPHLSQREEDILKRAFLGTYRLNAQILLGHLVEDYRIFPSVFRKPDRGQSYYKNSNYRFHSANNIEVLKFSQRR